MFSQRILATSPFLIPESSMMVSTSCKGRFAAASSRRSSSRETMRSRGKTFTVFDPRHLANELPVAGFAQHAAQRPNGAVAAVGRFVKVHGFESSAVI